MPYSEHPLPPETPTHAEILAPDALAIAPTEKRENPPWDFWDVLRIAVVALIAIGVLSVVVMGLALHGPADKVAAADMARNPRVVIPAQFAAYLLVVAFMMAVVRSRARRFWAAIRWNWPGAASWIGYGALGVALAIAIQSASALLPVPKSLPIDRYFRDMFGAYLMAAFGITVAPLVEELFFRGFLYPVVNRKWGVVPGVVITAFLFALLHEGQLAHAWAPLLLIFLVGVVLTAVRAWTASVAASFITHVGYNITLFLLLYLASDQFRHLERIS